MAEWNLHREMHMQGLLVTGVEDILLYGKMQEIAQLWSGGGDRSEMGPGNCGWLLVGIGVCVVLRWWIPPPRGCVCAVQLEVFRVPI